MLIVYVAFIILSALGFAYGKRQDRNPINKKNKYVKYWARSFIAGSMWR